LKAGPNLSAWSTQWTFLLKVIPSECWGQCSRKGSNMAMSDLMSMYCSQFTFSCYFAAQVNKLLHVFHLCKPSVQLKLYFPIANIFFSVLKKRIRLWHGYIYEAVEREKCCLCCFKHNNSFINWCIKNS
jgi:hypothetical protein